MLGDDFENREITSLTEEEWLIIQIRTLFSHPMLSAEILADALRITDKCAAEVMSTYMSEFIMNFEED